MWKISDEQLLHSYETAMHLRLEDAFIRLLRQEIHRRGLTIRPRVTR